MGVDTSGVRGGTTARPPAAAARTALCGCHTGTLCGCHTGTLCGCHTRTLCGCHTRTLCGCQTRTLCCCHTRTLCGCQTRTLCGCQTRRMCCCHTRTLAASHICVCGTQKQHVSGQKITQKSKMSRNGSPWLRLVPSGRDSASHGPPGAIGTTPGPQNGQKKFFFANFPPLGPPGPPCWGQPLRAGYTGRHSWDPCI